MCYMPVMLHVMSCSQMRNVVMRCGTMVWYMWNMVACCEDAKCGCGIPSDVEWFDGAILDVAV